MHLTLVSLVVFLVIAGVCGAIAQGVVGYSHGGFFTSVLLGLIGAFLGPWVADSLGLPAYFKVAIGGESFPIVWSIIGAALLVAVLSFFARGRSPWNAGRRSAWQ